MSEKISSDLFLAFFLLIVTSKSTKEKKTTVAHYLTTEIKTYNFKNLDNFSIFYSPPPVFTSLLLMERCAFLICSFIWPKV